MNSVAARARVLAAPLVLWAVVACADRAGDPNDVPDYPPYGSPEADEMAIESCVLFCEAADECGLDFGYESVQACQDECWTLYETTALPNCWGEYSDYRACMGLQPTCMGTAAAACCTKTSSDPWGCCPLAGSTARPCEYELGQVELCTLQYR